MRMHGSDDFIEVIARKTEACNDNIGFIWNSKYSHIKNTVEKDNIISRM